MGDELDQLFEQIPDRYIITEGKIDSEIVKSFYSTISKINPEITQEMLEKKIDLIFRNDVLDGTKQRILAELSSLGTVWAFRKIQQYVSVSEKKDDPWARIALYECQRRLEEDLVEESSGIINTGLGGSGCLLRYFFVVKSINDLLIHESMINKNMMELALELRSEIEVLKCTKKYLQGMVLLPMDVAVGKFIENGIEKINKEEAILLKDYMVTNTVIPSEEEIISFINE